MTNPIHQLAKMGQSVWYDNIERRLLDNGGLADMITNGDIQGLTSNPSIFKNAIVNSSDYDNALQALAADGKSTDEIIEHLTVNDIQEAAKLLLPLYEETKGLDGYASLEVRPTLAYDTDNTLAEAKRLWQWVDVPNLMIKIPATDDGLPAIRQAIAAGINVNVTLIFSIERYREVAEAYLLGLEDRLATGQPIDKIASVASFFISRLDSAVDKQLEGVGSDRAAKLMGKTAVANAKLAYQAFKEIFNTERFAGLQQQGANLQLPLWASTSTKNPAYPDTLYVDELIGRNTVNTVPPKTLDAFRDHGSVKETLKTNLVEANKLFIELAVLGISLADVTQKLEDDGVKAFMDAYQDLVETVNGRQLIAVQ
ncbi:MAG: transaldolase [Chloroflexi bacterium]|nr:MAG: transaldolase [Chloroflexota bacterium]